MSSNMKFTAEDEEFAAAMHVKLTDPRHVQMCQWCSVNDVRESQLRQEIAAGVRKVATLNQHVKRYAAEMSSISLSARNWRTAFGCACMVIVFFVAYEAYKATS